MNHFFRQGRAVSVQTVPSGPTRQDSSMSAAAFQSEKSGPSSGVSRTRWRQLERALVLASHSKLEGSPRAVTAALAQRWSASGGPEFLASPAFISLALVSLAHAGGGNDPGATTKAAAIRTAAGALNWQVGTRSVGRYGGVAVMEANELHCYVNVWREHLALQQ